MNVANFLSNPTPTLVPMSTVTAMKPAPEYDVTGSPTPQPAAVRFAMWNRVTANGIPNPLHLVYNRPASTQTLV